LRSPYRVSVVHLLRAHGVRHHEVFTTASTLLDNQHSQVVAGEPISVDLWLESASGALIATGTVATHYNAVCGRCLVECEGDVIADVDHELFSTDPTIDPLADFSYLVETDEIDLEPLVTDAIVLELPLAPLCRPDCAGLCPICAINRNEARCDCESSPTDQRWAILDRLRPAAES